LLEHQFPIFPIPCAKSNSWDSILSAINRPISTIFDLIRPIWEPKQNEEMPPAAFAGQPSEEANCQMAVMANGEGRQFVGYLPFSSFCFHFLLGHGHSLLPPLLQSPVHSKAPIQPVGSLFCFSFLLFMRLFPFYFASTIQTKHIYFKGEHIGNRLEWAEYMAITEINFNYAKKASNFAIKILSYGKGKGQYFAAN